LTTYLAQPYQIFAGGNNLQVGDKGSVLLTVEACTCGVSTIQNSATVDATSPSGDEIEDISTDGSDPDPDGDGNPDEDDVTEHTINCTVAIVCPPVASEINVQNDAENCTTIVSFADTTVDSNCEDVDDDDIQFMLSQSAIDPVSGTVVPAGIWMFGQASGLEFNVDTTTITYRIDPTVIPDGSNILIEECSFDIIVRDEQCPVFLTTLPEDITVTDCDIPDPFIVNPIWHLSDNCTAAEDIQVDYSEDMFDVVCASTFTLKRTWMITDESGNTCIHNHKIFVVDTTGPNILTPADTLIQTCQLDELVTCRDSIFVTGTSDTTLLLGGEWVLTTLVLKDTVEVCDTIFSPVPLTAGIAQVDDGLCSDPANVSIWFEDIVDVVCKGDKAAIVERIWYAEDECGNRSQASQFIQILDKNPPVLTCKEEATISLGADGTLTLSPEDVLDDYFDACFTDKDDIAVIAAPNFFDCNDLGTHRVLVSAKDPCSNKTSYCEVILQVVDTLAPQLNCPTDIINITINPLNCDAAFADITNSVLGADCDVIVSTDPPINAGLSPSITNITVTATDASGNSSSCDIAVNIEIEDVIDFSTALSCNNRLNVSLNGDCSLALTPDQILEGTQQICSELLCIEVEDPDGNDHLNYFDETDIDQLFRVKVVDCNGSGNSCWAEVLIEEKSIPQILWPSDTIVLCNEPTDTSYFKIGIPELLNCEPDLEMSFVDTYVEYEPCDPVRAQIDRLWSVRDNEGNQLDHIQIIRIVPFANEHLTFPEDISYTDPLACELVGESFDDIVNHRIDPTSIIHPDSTGLPGIFGLPLLQDRGLCMYSLGYSDEIQEICEGSFEILRTWRVRNICADNVVGQNPVEHLQVISVYDTKAPEIIELDSLITVSIDPWTCSYNGPLDLPAEVEDLCANIEIEAYVTAGGFIESIGSFETNNLEITAIDMPIGEHEVTYVFSDACRNITLIKYTVIVADLIAPTAVCKSSVTTSLVSSEHSEALSKVSVNSIDAGSKDACGEVESKILRKEDFDAGPVILQNGDTLFIDDEIAYQAANGCYTQGMYTEIFESDKNGSLDSNVIDYVLFDEFVKFCCTDIGIQDVVLRVKDKSGLSNICVTEVFVDNKIQDVLLCQPITIDCNDIESASTSSVQPIYSGCEVESSRLEYLDPEDVSSMCGRGQFFRTWYLDKNENQILEEGETSCIQQITIDNPFVFDPMTIKWPKHFDGSSYSGKNIECDESDTTQEIFVDNIEMGESFQCSSDASLLTPVWCGTSCGSLAYQFADDTISVSDACFKIIRRHTIIDWCVWQSNQSSSDNDSDSFIAVEDWAQGVCTSCPQSGPTYADPIYFRYDNVNIDGYYTFDQVVKVVDNTAPILSMDSVIIVQVLNGDQSKEGGEPCGENGIAFAEALDFCGSDQVGNNRLNWEVNIYNQAQDIIASYQFTAASGEVNVDIPTGQASDQYQIDWQVTDGCGNQTTSSSVVTFSDQKAPTPVCVSGISAGVSERSGSVTIWAGEFDNGSFDNCTIAEDLLFSIVLSGEDPINPTDVDFADQSSIILACQGSEFRELDVWVWDEDHNGDHCSVVVLLNENCEPTETGSSANISGHVKLEDGRAFENALVTLNTILPEYPKSILVNEAGEYAFENVASNYNYELAPEYVDDHLNGVSTLDLLLIQNHIIGQVPFESPYTLIAADAGNNNSVSAQDIITLRRLLIGIDQKDPSTDSWIFIDKKQNFVSESNPWPFVKDIEIANLNGDMQDQDFIAIKLGDVNNSVKLNEDESETRGTRQLFIDDLAVIQNEIIEIAFTNDDLSQDVYGMKFTLQHPGLSFVELVDENMVLGEKEIGVFDDKITLSWFNTDGVSTTDLFTFKFKVNESGLLSEKLRLTNNITYSEIYTGSEFDESDLVLDFISSESDFILLQNEPNPFSDLTNISFEIPVEGMVTISLKNSLGQGVFTHTDFYPLGSHSIQIQRDDLGQNGLYTYEVQFGNQLLVKSMLLIE